MLIDRDSARILDEADRAMLAFAEKLTLRHTEMEEADIKRLRAAGFSEENIVGILANAAYRNFANRINFAMGRVELDPEGPAPLTAALRTMRERSQKGA